ncbi:MAG: hypothetical protein O6951_10970, partial [Actinobacteria bacterium]|nr:hypothetical protein [Actinomycetota bacterium]
MITLVACGSESTERQIPADALVVANGTVIDGTGADPIQNGVVVIEGDRITAVGQTGDFAIPAEAQVIDASGGAILPGIINAHVHVTSPATQRLFLTEGITTVCDTGAPSGVLAQVDRDFGGRPVARRFRAGPIIGPPRGYEVSYEVTGPDEARAAVADLADRGADYIKIALDAGELSFPVLSLEEVRAIVGDVQLSFPVLSLDEVRAIVDEAHKRGLLVRAHAQHFDMFNLALDGGVDSI